MARAEKIFNVKLELTLRSPAHSTVHGVVLRLHDAHGAGLVFTRPAGVKITPTVYGVVSRFCLDGLPAFAGQKA
jgi:hypothetical protein